MEPIIVVLPTPVVSSSLSRQESLSVIREMLALQGAGESWSSCRGRLYGRTTAQDVLLEQVPEVDQIVGVFGREEIADVVDRAVSQRDEQRSLFRPAPVRALEDTARLAYYPKALCLSEKIE